MAICEEDFRDVYRINYVIFGIVIGGSHGQRHS